MPALLIAVVVLGAWGLIAVPQAQAMLAKDRSVWVRQDDDSWRYGGGSLTYSDYGTFDTTLPGLPGEPGMRVEEQDLYAEADRQIRAACGGQPGNPEDDDYDYESPEFLAWSECADPYWMAVQSRAVGWSKEVPRSAWGDFATLDIAMSALLGGAALALTLLVVTRRRPE
jgi:hypothetical protein